ATGTGRHGDGGAGGVGVGERAAAAAERGDAQRDGREAGRGHSARGVAQVLARRDGEREALVQVPRRGAVRGEAESVRVLDAAARGAGQLELEALALEAGAYDRVGVADRDGD